MVKHAGVSHARVMVRGDEQQLRIEVSDQGKGFDSQIDMFGARANGFGLWSIADRAQEVGGRFTMEASLGRGSRFELVFPLGAQLSAGVQRSYTTGSAGMSAGRAAGR